MKIQTQSVAPAPQAPQRSRVAIASNLKKERIMVDADGNQIDPRTRRIIKINTDK